MDETHQRPVTRPAPGRPRPIPPPPKPGPPVEIEDMPPEPRRRQLLLAGVASLLVVVLIGIGFLEAVTRFTGQERPFTEGESTVTAFIDAASRDDIPAMEALLSDEGRRFLTRAELSAISLHLKDSIGSIKKIERVDLAFLPSGPKEVKIFVRYVIQGASQTAMLETQLSRAPDGEYLLDRLTLR